MSSNISSDPDLHLRTATELEKEVASHFQAIARLRRHLNSLVPVNRLPLELLIEIFYLCQSQADHRPDALRRPHHYGWLTAAGVCHYWREAIMATPKLWSRIDLDHAAFSRLCSLPLAGRHPLHLAVTQWQAPQRDLFDEIITSRMEQVHSINIQIADDWDSSESNLLDSLDRVPPAISPLRSFRIEDIYLNHQDIPCIFMDCDFPEIRELDLYCDFGALPTHFMGSTLTHLKLRILDDHFEPGDPLVFTRCLSGMSRLELLHVENLSFRKDPNRGPCLSWFCENIPSPKPHRVTLTPPKGEREDYASLFTSLDFSLTSEARFKRLGQSGHEDSDILLRGLGKHFSSFIFRGLALHDRSPSSLVVSLSQTTDEPDIADMDVESPFSLWLGVSPSVVQLAFKTFFRYIDLHHIEMLHLSNSWVSSMSSDDWLHLFSTCHHLTTLSIYRVQNQSLLRATKILREDGEIPEAAGSNRAFRRMLVPKLKVISLNQVSWQGRLVEDILAFIDNRNRAQLPLEQINIEDCMGITQHMVHLLQRTGVMVEWDMGMGFRNPSPRRYSNGYEAGDYILPCTETGGFVLADERFPIYYHQR